MHARDRGHVALDGRRLLARADSIFDERANRLRVGRLIRLASRFAKRLEDRAVRLGLAVQ